MVRRPVPILVAGAINTDLVASMERAPGPGETVTGSSFAVHGGGKAANQAVAVSRAGGYACLVGSIGNDDFGRARLADLRADGIGIDWVLVNDQVASGVALILVEKGGENRIAYVPGATTTVPADHAGAALDAIRPGYVLAPNELPHAALLKLFELASQAGARVVLNATPDPELARDLLSMVTVLIVNEVEAAILLDVATLDNPESAPTRLRESGVETVVITMGRDGAIVGDGNGIEHHRPPDVRAVDTTGAGDTFCGAFVAELSRGATTSEAVRFAVTASAISVTRPGAQSSIPTRAEVMGLVG